MRDHGQVYSLKYLNTSLIYPSSLPAGVGFFVIEKKDYIDYRGLNDITVKNRPTSHLTSSVFGLLQGALVFTKLVLRNAYHLVWIHDGDEWKTAFNTPKGHFEYLVLPFSLTNASVVFQALVNDLLRDKFVFVYLDDILIFFPSSQVHTQHILQVIQQ